MWKVLCLTIRYKARTKLTSQIIQAASRSSATTIEGEAVEHVNEQKTAYISNTDRRP